MSPEQTLEQVENCKINFKHTFFNQNLNFSILKAERDLRVAQSEFDRQVEVTRLLLEGLSSTQVNHLRYLHAFVESQVKYYAQCNRVMQDLQKDLAR